ncbi:Splicing factor U2AF-associated protein [Carpediemonas membranifera]|uniref:Splicing factor U2AF-associated protein n=1 Tax=Carpediemonas membranifera TaxID=201153 RepID=A0A8J6BA67_9EUKA|nr:Splicing factor U2AF-associated protein [Carpediemonas membranifera]|eukprot:KAG9393162.1 Splicing factor U2AF-associated protein [Carpediemonas membranifera]
MSCIVIENIPRGTQLRTIIQFVRDAGPIRQFHKSQEPMISLSYPDSDSEGDISAVIAFLHELSAEQATDHGILDGAPMVPGGPRMKVRRAADSDLPRLFTDEIGKGEAKAEEKRSKALATQRRKTDWTGDDEDIAGFVPHTVVVRGAYAPDEMAIDVKKRVREAAMKFGRVDSVKAPESADQVILVRYMPVPGNQDAAVGAARGFMVAVETGQVDAVGEDACAYLWDGEETFEA